VEVLSRRRGRTAAATRVAAALAILLHPTLVAAQDAAPGEYEVKAAFIYNFARFVEWPQPAIGSDRDPLTIAVLGEGPIGGILEKVLQGKTVGARSLTIRRFAALGDLRPTPILFIGRQEESDLTEILSKLGRAPVLTVCEAEGAARLGCVVNFIIVDNKVRFEIAPESAKAAGLKISSKLLSVAKIVSTAKEGN